MSQIRSYEDSDGQCYADGLFGCDAMSAYEVTCGTYRCPFYKPIGCEDWVKLESKDHVTLYPPEEYFKTRTEETEACQ